MERERDAEIPSDELIQIALFFESVRMGGDRVLGVVWYFSSNIYMTPSFLGLGDGTSVSAVVDLGGVGIQKKIIPRREPLCHSRGSPRWCVPPAVLAGCVLLCKMKKNVGMEHGL